MQAVQYLDQRMREIRDAGKIAGTRAHRGDGRAQHHAHELLGAKKRTLAPAIRLLTTRHSA